MKQENHKLTSGVVHLQRVQKSKLNQARVLRKNMTVAEKILWERLRRKQVLGIKFRRQQIIEGFIVDFFCHMVKLVIETDGEIHNSAEQKKLDLYRREVFRLRGLAEMRFTNNEVLHNIDRVVNIIKEFVAETIKT